MNQQFTIKLEDKDEGGGNGLNVEKQKKKKEVNYVSRRVLLLVAMYGILIATIGVDIFKEISYIKEKNIQIAQIEKEIDEEILKLNGLETTIKKLNDKDYIAKYIRDKFNLSLDDELIFKLKDN